MSLFMPHVLTTLVNMMHIHSISSLICLKNWFLNMLHVCMYIYLHTYVYIYIYMSRVIDK